MIVAIVCLVAPVVVPVLILAVAALLDYRSKAATVEPSYPAQKYEIPNLSALTRPLALKKFTVEGVSWCISLEPSSDHKFPGIFLKRCTRRSPPLRVKLSVTFVHPKNPDRNQLDGLEAIYYDEPIGWPAWHLAEAEPTLPGLILDDKIVLQTHVWVSKDLNPGSASMPVLEESKILRTRALVEMLSDSGENRLEPDVMLKLGNDMLPAHSAFLAQSSGYFKAKFQSAMTGSKNNIVDIQDVAAEDIKVVVRYMYGELDAIPEDRLHSLVLATKRMQVRELMERCVNLLKIRLTLDSFEETAMLANQVDNHGLYMACVEFVVSAWKEDRSALSLIKHGVLNRILATAPDLASRLIDDILERIVPKKTGKL